MTLLTTIRRSLRLLLLRKTKVRTIKASLPIKVSRITPLHRSPRSPSLPPVVVDLEVVRDLAPVVEVVVVLVLGLEVEVVVVLALEADLAQDREVDRDLEVVPAQVLVREPLLLEQLTLEREVVRDLAVALALVLEADLAQVREVVRARELVQERERELVQAQDRVDLALVPALAPVLEAALVPEVALAPVLEVVLAQVREVVRVREVVPARDLEAVLVPLKETPSSAATSSSNFNKLI